MKTSNTHQLLTLLADSYDGCRSCRICPPRRISGPDPTLQPPLRRIRSRRSLIDRTRGARLRRSATRCRVWTPRRTPGTTRRPRPTLWTSHRQRIPGSGRSLTPTRSRAWTRARGFGKGLRRSPMLSAPFVTLLTGTHMSPHCPNSSCWGRSCGCRALVTSRLLIAQVAASGARVGPCGNEHIAVQVARLCARSVATEKPAGQDLPLAMEAKK